jgi:replicative DNA helicase
VQWLLLRLGIRSAINGSRKVKAYGKPGETYRLCYSVRIQGAASQAQFLRSVGCHGQRGECINRALEILDGIKENPNVDLIPWPVVGKIRDELAGSELGVVALAEKMGEVYNGSYFLGNEMRQRRFSRKRLALIGQVLGSEELSNIASSDLFWDEVVEISALGEQPTFDCTIEDHHNFIADGIVAHNSIEADADTIILLYRDEVYSPDSPDRGTAEVIVAKNRNGPTGVVHLAWLAAYTKFASMARM